MSRPRCSERAYRFIGCASGSVQIVHDEDGCATQRYRDAERAVYLCTIIQTVSLFSWRALGTPDRQLSDRQALTDRTREMGCMAGPTLARARRRTSDVRRALVGRMRLDDCQNRRCELCRLGQWLVEVFRPLDQLSDVRVLLNVGIAVNRDRMRDVRVVGIITLRLRSSSSFGIAERTWAFCVRIAILPSCCSRDPTTSTPLWKELLRTAATRSLSEDGLIVIVQPSS